MTYPWKITAKQIRAIREADKKKALFIKTKSTSFFQRSQASILATIYSIRKKKKQTKIRTHTQKNPNKQ